MSKGPQFTFKVGFLGAGNMAGALAQGIIAAKLAKPADLAASDISHERREAFHKATGAKVFEENDDVARCAQIVVLAVKPQVTDEVVSEVGPIFKPTQVLVSIAAGVSTTHIEEFLIGAVPVVRVMPNTPALIRKGISALSPGKHAGAEHVERVRKLLAAVGEVVEVPESLMDAVTAVSGSGPAYFFYFIEALARAGVQQGLPEEVAWSLARSTALGASELAIQSQQSVMDLRRQVTSPGGTTEAAIKVFDEGKLADLVRRAVAAAAKRAAELGK